MPLKIVRNDITKMNTEAIVNTANDHVSVGTGCDHAIYTAAGYDELLAYREKHIGFVQEGQAFITPAFNLPQKYIIHAVSPHYVDGEHGEEEKLRSCYKESLKLAVEHEIKSIAFPLISTGGFGYPKEDGIRIAVDEINAFLLENKIDVYLVVFGSKATSLGEKLYPDLEEYIDQNYVKDKFEEEYVDAIYPLCSLSRELVTDDDISLRPAERDTRLSNVYYTNFEDPWDEEIEELDKKLKERLKHKSDTFSEYLMYLIESKGLDNVDVYKRAYIDKKTFSKIKNNPEYQPKKITALCLCVGTMLSLDETRDLLARAGYALSPSDLTDIIFSFYIENKHYDVLDIDIKLEEYGLEPIIS